MSVPIKLLPTTSSRSLVRRSFNSPARSLGDLKTASSPRAAQPPIAASGNFFSLTLPVPFLEFPSLSLRCSFRLPLAPSLFVAARFLFASTIKVLTQQIHRGAGSRLHRPIASRRQRASHVRSYRHRHRWSDQPCTSFSDSTSAAST